MLLISKDDLKLGGQSLIIAILTSAYCMFDWASHKSMKFFHSYTINAHKYHLTDLMNSYVIIS